MKKISILLSLALSLSAVSCDEWLDINSDPNSVADIENNSILLPAVELNLMSVTGFYGHLLGSYYAEQYAIKPGGPQYLGLSHWDTKDGTLGSTWSNRLYTSAYQKVANNAKKIRENAAESESWGDYLAATILMVYNYQILVDGFGEIPYSEALNPSNIAPKYDDGKDVYASLIAELDTALAKVSFTDVVCDNMLFSSSSDINNWIKFGNALKLKLLMRECDTVDVKSKLDALIAEDNFPESDIMFKSSVWTNQAGKDNPVFSELVRQRGDIKTGRTIEICAHMAVTATMQEVSDTNRLAAKFVPSVAYNNFEGDFIDEQQSKEINAGKLDEDTYAELNIKYDTPIYFLTVAETDFFIAEYYAKANLGNDAAKAKEYYEKAIDASFATHGVEGAADIYGAGKKYAWDSTKALELIGIQKWIALANINGFESWCELRRLGYPAFNSKTGAEIYEKWDELAKANVAANKANPTPLAQDLIDAGVYTPGTIFTPVYVVGLPDNTLLGRLPYVTSSRTTNANAPQKQKAPKDKVFWAK